MHRLRAHGPPRQAHRPGLTLADGFAERLIGSIRRECVDHVVVLGEAHLRRILTRYSAYYNELRTHRSLEPGHAGLKDPRQPPRATNDERKARGTLSSL